MSTNVWDQVDPVSSGDFPEPFKFDTLGDAIAGEISNVRVAEFDGKRIPELWIVTEQGERGVLCGQADLKRQLLEVRPQVGDRIAIVFTDTRKAKLGTAKIFEVQVKRADGTPAAAAPAPAPTTKSAADLL